MPSHTRPASAPFDALLDQARTAARRAHAPHSDFRVGAALLFDDGSVVVGCNVESASYGLTICAERNAMFAAVAAGKAPARALAVTCLDGDPVLDPASVMPCGACRQVMAELLAPFATIIVDGVGEFSTAELLPRAFHLSGSPAASGDAPMPDPHPCRDND